MSNRVELLEGAWVAIQAMCGTETLVAEALRARSYNVFLPFCCGSGSRSADRRRKALFPGYLFCRYICQPKHRIVEAAGVVRIVGFGTSPAPLQEAEVNAIYQIVNSERHSRPWMHLKTGQEVTVRHGPLSGLSGTLVRVSSGPRLIATLPLLQRSVSVELHYGDLEEADAQRVRESLVEERVLQVSRLVTY